MQRTETNSSLVKSVGYLSAAQVLDIEFHSGAVRRYYDVPPSLYTNLMAADSLGRYYNAHIKGKYDSRDISGLPEVSSKAIAAMQLALHDLEHQDFAPYTLDDEDHPLHASVQALREALREAGVEPDPVERTIAVIMEQFQWEKVRRAMLALNWHWVIDGKLRVPQVEDLKATARRLLRGVAADPEHKENGTGGLVVRINEEGRLQLDFVLEYAYHAEE
jgi:hypothetical protein